MVAAPKEVRQGRYVLLAPLGQGSQGTTWDAVDKREGRAVAVKAFDVRGARSWKDVELAEREASVLSELRHPLLPRYIEHFEEDGMLYLAMEKVEGTPLSELQKGARAARMTEPELLRFLRDADEALSYLHGRSPPVVHRDLKPSNVIRRPDGSFAFVDFGAVKSRLHPDGGSTVVGTFGYMAPEQFQGRAGPGSDVYSIGATALALLTGEEPEKLPHKGLTLDVHAALGNRVSPRLQEALARMLEPDPDRRAASIGPLLGAKSPRAEGGPAAGAATSSRQGRRDQRREIKREAKGEARRARREARRERRRLRGDREPFAAHGFIGFLVSLALAVAQVAVLLALNVVVPLVLRLLSVVFGKGLLRAAQAVRSAGERAGEALDESRRDLARESGPGEGREAAGGNPPVRVDTGGPRVRVAAGPRAPGRESEEDEDAIEGADEAERRRRSR